MSERREHIVMGVCTCQRPQLLKACLESLEAQDAPDGTVLQIVVVDNDEQASARPIVEAFSANARTRVHYVVEPIRSIAKARNAILAKALELDADWLTMIDDDETADRDWIVKLMAAEYRDSAILGGLRHWVFPEPRPFWALERQPKLFAEGASGTRIGTNNVRIDMKVVRSGLRFNETYGLSGGEDFQFFADAAKAGFSIRRTRQAVTREVLHASRMSYRFMMSRHYAYIAWLALRDRQEKGIQAVLLQVPMLVFLTVVGVVEVVISPFGFALGRRRFKQVALRGGKRLAHVAGTIAALVGHQPEPYRVVDGH